MISGYNYQRIDIAFDIYLESSSKQQERKRRGKDEVIETKIANIEQALPVEMDKFWGSSNNKIQLQQSFTEWIKKTSWYQKPLYLGGANKDLTVKWEKNLTNCFEMHTRGS